MAHVITTRGGARRCNDRRVGIEERAGSRARLVILPGRSLPEFVRNLCRSLDHPVARVHEPHVLWRCHRSQARGERAWPRPVRRPLWSHEPPTTAWWKCSSCSTPPRAYQGHNAVISPHQGDAYGLADTTPAKPRRIIFLTQRTPV